jgi:DNA-binding CsgD family transcriptional regulator
MFRLMGELGELPPDLSIRTNHLLAGLTPLTGARVISWVATQRAANGSAGRPAPAATQPDRLVVGPGAVAGLVDSEIRVISRFLQTLHPADPLSPLVYPAVEAGEVMHVRIEQVMPRRRWHGTAHFNEVRAPAGIDDAIIHSRPARGPGGARWIRTLCVHRPLGEAPFGQRQSELLGIFIGEALTLLDRTDAGMRAAPGVVLAPPFDPAQLPPRLREVLSWALAGMSLKEIAARMHLSRHTVKDYIKDLYRRAGVSSRGELMARFVERPRETHGPA